MSENSFKIREKFINKLVDKLEDFNSDLILLAKVDKKIYKKNNSQKGGASVDTRNLELSTYAKEDELKKQKDKINDAVKKAGTLTDQINKINTVLKGIQEQIDGFDITIPNFDKITLDVDSLTDDQKKEWKESLASGDYDREKILKKKFPNVAKNLLTFSRGSSIGSVDSSDSDSSSDSDGSSDSSGDEETIKDSERVAGELAAAELAAAELAKGPRDPVGRAAINRDNAAAIARRVANTSRVASAFTSSADSARAKVAARTAVDAARVEAARAAEAARADAVVAAGDNGESEEDVANSITSDAINEAVVRAAATDSDATPDTTPDTTPDATPGAATGVAPVPGNKGKLKDELKEARMTVKAANALREGGKDRNRSEMNAVINNVTLPKGNPRFPTLNVGRATGSSTPGAAPGAPPDNIFSPLLDNSTPVATPVGNGATPPGAGMRRAVGKVSAVNSLIEGDQDEEKRSANKRAQ